MEQLQNQALPTTEFHLTQRQTLAFNLLNNTDDAKVLYGGAKGGGKSYLFCLWVVQWTRYLIQLLGLTKPAHPIALGFIGRKQGTDFNHTTLETFKKIIPSDIYDLRTGDKEIIIDGVAKVFYGGLDDQERIKKFNSMELAFLGIDQAEETERTDVDVLQAALRLKHNGVQPPYKELYTANPADCWLKEDFIDLKRPGYHFIPALPKDNPHLPDVYVQRLKDAFRHSQALLSAYLDGNWFALQASNALFSSNMLQGLRDVNHHWLDTRRIIACDPSLGGDECVTYVIENYTILDTIILHERDTMKVAGHLVTAANKWNVKDFAIDTVGIGHGIGDRVQELLPDAQVIYICSSESATYPDKYYNSRAEMWWYAMIQVQDKKIPYMEDEELRAQLIAMRFKVINSNGKIQLEPKDEVKKRIGRSPDRADAFIYGIWGQQYARPMTKDRWKLERSNHSIYAPKVSAMAA